MGKVQVAAEEREKGVVVSDEPWGGYELGHKCASPPASRVSQQRENWLASAVVLLQPELNSHVICFPMGHFS